MMPHTLKGASLVLCLICQMASADPTVIADMSRDSPSQWRVFTDKVMGGVSEGRAEIGNGVLRLTGAVSTANNGGFIQARRDVSGLPADATALTVEARGDGQVYYIHLRTIRTRLPWQYYQAAFTAPQGWTRITLPLSAFRPSGRLPDAPPLADEVRSVAVVAYGRDHMADVSLRRITAD